MMQRPITRLVSSNDGEFPIWSNYQVKNLKSAIAYALLTNPNTISEERFYETIVEIPHYDSIIGQILDKEDEVLLVKDNIEEFQSLYRPLIYEYFSDEIEIDEKEGIFTIKNESIEDRIKLMRHLNDNIFQNIEKKYK